MMAFAFNSKSWILLGAVIVVVLSGLQPLATGEDITTDDYSSLTTTSATTAGQFGPGDTTTGGQPGPGVTTTAGQPGPGVTTTAGQPGPGVTTTAGQPGPGVTTTAGQPGPGVTTTEGHTTPPAGQAAAGVQTQIEAAITNCTELANCVKDNKVEPSNADVKDVCKKMEGFYVCIESKCSSSPNLDVILKPAKENYQDCSGCALQVSTIIMLLAIVASYLV